MSGANTFFNAMQWWNDEIQTSQLRKINDSLNANLQSLKETKDSEGEENRLIKIKSAKNAVFSARKLLDEVEENIKENPNIALFLYIKVMDAMGTLNDDLFDDFSDKEFFLSIENKYNQYGDELKLKFGQEYISQLQKYHEMKTLYISLLNLGAYKDIIQYMRGDSYNGFWGIKWDKLRQDISSIGAKWKRTPLSDDILNSIGKDHPRYIVDQAAKHGEIDLFVNAVCKFDCFNWGNHDSWVKGSAEELWPYIEKLDTISEEIVEKTREYTGIEMFDFRNDLDKRSIY